jgi:hypothetical protein
MTARGKKLKRGRGPSMPFGELVQKLWQPDSGALEPKATAGREAAIAKPKRKS